MKYSGNKIRAADFNVTAALAKAGATPYAGGGWSFGDNRGQTFNAPSVGDAPPPGCVWAVFHMGTYEKVLLPFVSAPMFGVVRVRDVPDSYANAGSSTVYPVGTCASPDAPGLGASLGVLQQPAVDGQIVIVRVKGPSVVLYNSVAGIAVRGDRLTNTLRRERSCLDGQQWRGQPCGLWRENCQHANH